MDTKTLPFPVITHSAQAEANAAATKGRWKKYWTRVAFICRASEDFDRDCRRAEEAGRRAAKEFDVFMSSSA
jgi:hypothetical protein